MKNDPHVSIGIGLAEAYSVAKACLRENWKAIGAAWFLTNFAGMLSFFVLYPPWVALDPAEVIGSFRYGIYYVVYTVISGVGFIFSVMIVQAAASGRRRTDYGTVVDESVRNLIRYLMTAFMSFLRIGLWSLGGIPVAAAFAYLYVTISGQSQPGPAFGLLVTTPIVIMSVLAYVRFGWALFFTVISGDTPIYSMYHSQSMFLNNRPIVWMLAAIVFLIPTILPVLSAFNLLGLGDGLEHVVTFASSAWTYAASVLATVIVMHAKPELDESISSNENS